MLEDEKRKIGSVEKKLLLILLSGISLSLTRRPDKYFKVLTGFSKDLAKINQEYLNRTIRRLYQSRMIDCKEENNGTISMILSGEGKKKIISYNLDDMKIKKPDSWDGYWRIIIFDIPENRKKARDALSAKLKKLGFLTLQKSVFVYPYPCKNEIDFIVEIFKLRPYVRSILAKEIDTAIELKRKFKL